MRITKMHGLGNDYVYVNGFEEKLLDPPRLARRLADRHFGVGGDGLIIIQPPAGPQADCRMEMYNADGSRAQMCGNGIRCVAKFAFDRGLAKSEMVNVETDAGLRRVKIGERLDAQGHPAAWVTVDMGEPRLARRNIPASLPGDRPGDADRPAVEVPIAVSGVGEVSATLVSMGNPHCVVRLQPRQGAPMLAGGDPSAALAALDLERIGPLFEHHAAFPQRINTEFIAVKNPRELDFRVWERGSGETLACGTGACAAVVAGSLGGWCEREATVHLRGGDLSIRWDAESDKVFMTGPAIEVFTAEIHPSWLEDGDGR